MEQSKDSIVDCDVCKGNCCYTTKLTDEITNKQCFGCGFFTSTLMKEGSDFYVQQMDILPELYKELAIEYKDTQEVWIPTTVNIPEKGMIFANGKSVDSWKWAAVKAIDIKKEDQHKFPNPNKKGEFYTRKMDMTTLKEFDKKDYIGAMEFLGLLDNEE